MRSRNATLLSAVVEPHTRPSCTSISINSRVLDANCFPVCPSEQADQTLGCVYQIMWSPCSQPPLSCALRLHRGFSLNVPNVQHRPNARCVRSRIHSSSYGLQGWCCASEIDDSRGVYFITIILERRAQAHRRILRKDASLFDLLDVDG